MAVTCRDGGRLQGTQEAKREDNLTAMFKPGQAPSERQVDDGSGTLTIWYLNGMDVVRGCGGRLA